MLFILPVESVDLKFGIGAAFLPFIAHSGQVSDCLSLTGTKIWVVDLTGKVVYDEIVMGDGFIVGFEDAPKFRFFRVLIVIGHGSFLH